MTAVAGRDSGDRLSGDRVLLLLVCAVISVSYNGEICEARTSAVMKVSMPHGGVLVGRHWVSVNGRHMRAFMGIPYAQPPVGELRFKPPVPFGAWSGERLAVKDAPICMQRDPFRRDMDIEGSEDCLYINVYTPETPRSAEPLPVMVWFHGGGWQCGSGISCFYGPDFFMDHDIVLVSANFRLGPLGFLSTETLECPGNFGLKDQVEVLKWVQTNIAVFGGNPESVTIFGESAGGASVTYHMLSEKSKGLFHKGIAQSGTYYNPWAQPAHKQVAAKRTRKVAELVGCNPQDQWPELLDCLRAQEAEAVVATLYDLFEWEFDPMIPFPPVVEPPHEGAFLTVWPRDAGMPHGFALPLLIGATSEEGLLRTAAILNMPHLLEDFKAKFHSIVPMILYYDHHTSQKQEDITEQIESFYFKEGHNYNKSHHQNLTDLLSDSWFIAGIDEYIRLRLDPKKGASKAPTYVYLFEHKGAASFSEIFKGGEDFYGVSHAEELQYLFPIGRELFITAAPTAADLHLRNALVSMWVNFANSSNPTPRDSGLPTWTPALEYPFDYAHIGGKSHEDWSLLRMEKSLYQDRINFWRSLQPHLPAEQMRKDEL